MDYWLNSLASVFVGYKGFENKTSTSGPLWTDHSLLGGVKFDIGSPAASVRMEPMIPSPSVFRVMHKY